MEMFSKMIGTFLMIFNSRGSFFQKEIFSLLMNERSYFIIFEGYQHFNCPYLICKDVFFFNLAFFDYL